jgi:Protein of unknown function (DUF664)
VTWPAAFRLIVGGRLDDCHAARQDRPCQLLEELAMVKDLIDPRRTAPAHVLPERAMLERWLEFHRATLLLNCEDLDDARRKARPVPTSKLSLHGLVRHMAEVERNWFTRGLLAIPDASFWYDVTIEDSELVPLDAAD